MKSIQKRAIGYSSLAALFFSVLWLVFLILYSLDKLPVTSLDIAIANLRELNWIFYITFFNVGILTLVVPVFFLTLYRYFRSDHELLSQIGIIYVPVYMTLNLIVYFSQMAIIPELNTDNMGLGSSERYLGYFIFSQNWPASFMGFINALAYAILGIPSVIFGCFSLGDIGKVKAGGFFLMLSGIFSLAGFSGFIFDISWLLEGVMISGILFILSLIFYTLLVFRK